MDSDYFRVHCEQATDVRELICPVCLSKRKEVWNGIEEFSNLEKCEKQSKNSRFTLDALAKSTDRFKSSYFSLRKAMRVSICVLALHVQQNDETDEYIVCVLILCVHRLREKIENRCFRLDEIAYRIMVDRI